MTGNETISDLSAFYIALWSHLDAFFDDNRWLRLYPVAEIDVRIGFLRKRYSKLKEKIGEEPTLSAQVEQDFTKVESLTKEYLAKEPKPGGDWFLKARAFGDYLQELGLRYGELSAKEGGLIK